MKCTVEQLRTMFRMEPDGRLFWIAPPKNHKDMTGREAGSPIPGHSGKTYWAVQINERKCKRGHIVFCFTHGRWPSLQIDHINGNSLDDAPANLREATQTQNAWNHKGRAKRSPLPMGIRVAKSGRFVARIAVNKTKITIGTYDTVDEAVNAYRAARLQHFGEYA